MSESLSAMTFSCIDMVIAALAISMEGYLLATLLQLRWEWSGFSYSLRFSYYFSETVEGKTKQFAVLQNLVTRFILKCKVPLPSLEKAAGGSAAALGTEQEQLAQ